MWHFSQKDPLDRAAWDTEVDPNTAGLVYHHLRDVVTAHMESITRDEKIGGDPYKRVVIIDETHITRQRKNKGGLSRSSHFGP